MATLGDAAVWTVAALAAAGIIIRPWRLPEALWAVLGAAGLTGAGVLPWQDALAGIGRGRDVYLFLTGMMLLAEAAREEGFFNWLAAFAVTHAGGSAERLFGLVYAVGAVVTVLLSNDATAVVLTPAVYAVTRAAGATPLPHLLVCAFVANAASFVLPISNPANLVVFGAAMPQLLSWLEQFAAPSIAAIAVTYGVLYATQRRTLRADKIARDVPRPQLSRGGRLAALGIAATAVALVAYSAFDSRLGLPTFICGCATTMLVAIIKRQSPWPVLAGVSWGVLPLVAGLFVLVEGLERTGAIALLGGALHGVAGAAAPGAAGAAGAYGIVAFVVAAACNLMNNLPAALMAGSVIAAEQVSRPMTGTLLIAVDLGPNLSVTGSLATILWLVALRREGEHVDSWRFFRLGALVMTPALAAAIATVALLAVFVR